MQMRAMTAGGHALDAASKTAAVTVYFWVMKILATTLGEMAGDFISMTLGLGYYAGLAITRPFSSRCSSRRLQPDGSIRCSSGPRSLRRLPSEQKSPI